MAVFTGPNGQGRDPLGKFTAVQSNESGLVLPVQTELVSLDAYEHVEHEDEIYRQTQQMVRLAMRSGLDPSEAGSWIREFDPNEKSAQDAA